MRKILTDNKKNISVFFSLIAVLLLGAGLRIYDLGRESLWFDEAGSIDLAMRYPFILFTKFQNSPLYFLLLKYWMNIFGVSECALRSLSVIFGIGAIFLIYKLASLLFDEKTGLLSAFLLCISPLHIRYCQEIRNYSLFIFLTLLSMLIFIRLLKKNQIKLYIWSALVNILLVYTFSFGALVVFIQNIFFFLGDKQKKKWVISHGLVLIFFLLWFIPICITAVKEPWIKISNNWIKNPGFGVLAETFTAFSYGGENYGGNDFQINPAVLRHAAKLSYLFGILFFLGISSLINPKNKEIVAKRPARELLLFGLWLLSPLIPFVFSKVFFPVYVIRYVIFALPAFLIIIAMGINKITGQAIQMSVVLTITILTACALSVYYPKHLKINWREAVNYINKQLRKDDIIIVSLAKQTRLFGYYGKNGLRYHKNGSLNIDRELGPRLVEGGFIYFDGENKMIGVNNVTQLKRIIGSRNIIPKNSNIWLVLSRWAVYEGAADSIKEYMDSVYQNKAERRYEGIAVYQYNSIECF